eukprot:538196_1
MSDNSQQIEWIINDSSTIQQIAKGKPGSVFKSNVFKTKIPNIPFIFEWQFNLIINYTTLDIECKLLSFNPKWKHCTARLTIKFEECNVQNILISKYSNKIKSKKDIIIETFILKYFRPQTEYFEPQNISKNTSNKKTFGFFKKKEHE